MPRNSATKDTPFSPAIPLLVVMTKETPLSLAISVSVVMMPEAVVVTVVVDPACLMTFKLGTLYPMPDEVLLVGECG